MGGTEAHQKLFAGRLSLFASTLACLRSSVVPGLRQRG
jgi:hypothetical protein